MGTKPMRDVSFVWCVAAALGLVSVVSSTASAGDCVIGRPDPLELLDWSEEPGPRGPRITFKLRSNLAKAVLSISARLVFQDSEGNTLTELPLNPGIRIAPGAEKIEEDAILDPEMNDALRPENAHAKICTRYVVYADGVFDEF